MDDLLKKEIINKYVTDKEKKFYQHWLFYSINKIVSIENNTYKGETPDLELMGFYTQFLIFYRKTGDINALNVAKFFRKLAHKIYRILLKKQLINYNIKFLNEIK